MRLSTKLLMFVALLIAHWMCQFLSWASADAVHSSGKVRILWNVLSAPSFYAVPEAVSNRYFWAVATANSVVWAFSLTTFVAWWFVGSRAQVRR
jgi:hypothetical protein